ncbi:DUF4189 domain-containing protein [Nocardia sp. 004]|uniref:DUF4189 domain-containing protein n=1 Tax=Nocardia sp. 004 TaxID=3385978 RepID=UPI0039A2103D
MPLLRKTAVMMLPSAVAAFVMAGTGTAQAQNVYGSAMIEPTAIGATFYASWSANSQQEADEMAAQQCGTKPGGGPVCERLVQWVNGCAAIATRGVEYRAAAAPTRDEAIRAALAAANAGPSSGSAILPAGLAAIFCTPNAG